MRRPTLLFGALPRPNYRLQRTRCRYTRLDRSDGFEMSVSTWSWAFCKTNIGGISILLVALEKHETSTPGERRKSRSAWRQIGAAYRKKLPVAAKRLFAFRRHFSEIEVLTAWFERLGPVS